MLGSHRARIFFVRSFSGARGEGANSSIKLEGGEWRSTNLVISSYVNGGNDGNKSGWDTNRGLSTQRKLLPCSIKCVRTIFDCIIDGKHL